MLINKTIHYENINTKRNFSTNINNSNNINLWSISNNRCNFKRNNYIIMKALPRHILNVINSFNYTVDNYHERKRLSEELNVLGYNVQFNIAGDIKKVSKQTDLSKTIEIIILYILSSLWTILFLLSILYIIEAKQVVLSYSIIAITLIGAFILGCRNLYIKHFK